MNVARPAPSGVEITKAMLDRLDDLALRQLASSAGAGRRAHSRYRYRHREINLLLLHPGGGQTKHLVCTRNISVGGLAFLHAHALQLETNCRLILPGFDRRLYPIDGAVRSCRLIEGAIHEAGVEFREPVDIAAFIGFDVSGRIRTG
jgi:hypothetical protein